MSTSTSVSKTIPPVLFSRADEARFLRELLEDFENLGTTSDQIVSAPTDAVRIGGQFVEIPRYVFLGGQPGQVALKLAIYAGWRGGDLGPTYAALATLQHLLRWPEDALGYVLSVYPLVHASAFRADVSPVVRDLATMRWNDAAGTEIERLAADFRAWELDGWINIRSITGSDVVRATAIGLPIDPAFFPVEAGRYCIQWALTEEIPPGPLDLEADLGHRPFGLHLDVPAHWPDALFAGAVSTTLRAFLVRYRASRAYALHL